MISRSTLPLAVLILVVVVGWYALAMASAWMLTSPDPTGRASGRYEFVRIGIRSTLVANALVIGLWIIATAAHWPGTLLLFVLGVVLSPYGPIVVLGQLLCLQELGVRIAIGNLARQARIYFLAMGICYAILVLCAAMLAAVMLGGISPYAGWSFDLIVVGIVISLLGLIVFGVRYLSLLAEFEMVIREELVFQRRL